MTTEQNSKLLQGPLFYILYFLFSLALTSCMDMDDTTPPVKATIQLVRPDAFVHMADLSGYSVTLQSGLETITATTDSEGRITLSELAPNTYDISVAGDISHSQYEQYTGQTVGGDMDFTLTATLNQQVLDADVTIQLPLLAFPKESLVIGKVYNSYSKISGGTFQIGKYVELYNNSDRDVDAAGLYLALMDSDNPVPFKVYPYDEANTPGMLHAKQVFRIPADAPVTVAPGGTLLLVNSAFDYSDRNEYESDLSEADFEAKNTETKDPTPNNPAVPALELVYTAYTGNGSITNMNIVQGGPAALVIFRTDDDVEGSWPRVYAYGKTTGRQFLEIPVSCVLDGVDILKHSVSFEAGANINTKRLFSEVDAGFTFVGSAAGTAGETLVRKTMAVMADGRKVLQDTNNSTNDFLYTTKTEPRHYNENNEDY